MKGRRCHLRLYPFRRFSHGELDDFPCHMVIHSAHAAECASRIRTQISSAFEHKKITCIWSPLGDIEINNGTCTHQQLATFQIVTTLQRSVPIVIHVMYICTGLEE